MNSQQLSFLEPRARPSDPSTSHLAAVAMQPGNDDAVAYIRRALERCGPLTQEQIAHEVGRDVNARGRQVIVWSLTSREDADEGVETVTLKTDAL